MSLKLKVLGLGLLAVMATGAFAVMNAGAVTGGHFVHHASTNHADIIGTENTTDKLHFVSADGSQIGCDEEKYTGTVTAKTFTEVKIVPDWEKCYTTPHNGNTFGIHENGCYLTFTSGKTGQTHHTAHFICPTKPLEITHENCTIRVPTQTTQGVTYTAIKLPNAPTVDGVTVKVTAKVTSHYESGICIFLGTVQQAEMAGGVIVEALETGPVPKLVNLTSTTGA
jgi:hypothetical protein